MKRFVLVGSGWRSLFYARLAERHPEEFQLNGWMIHSPEKQEQYRAVHNTFISGEMDAVLRQPHDLVVLSMPDLLNKEYLLELAKRDEDILTETSFLKQPEEELRDIARQTKGHTIEVAEQYHLLPYHLFVRSIVPKLGPITECTVASCHFHHAVSLLRGYLGAGFSPCSIEARSEKRFITETGSRYGYTAQGTRKEIERTLAILHYPGCGTGYYDFTGEEYHSTILTGHFALRGERGEVFDREARYLDENGLTVAEHIDGSMDDLEAIASCLRIFGNGYTLRDGLWDALTGQAIKRAAQEKKPVIFAENGLV